MALQGNWVDLVIILILFYYLTVAWRVGFIYLLADFGSFLLSLLISLRVYKFTASFLRDNFSLTAAVSNALGFIATAIFIEILLDFLFGELLKKLPVKVLKSKYNRLLGILPALGEGVILVAFLLTAIIVMPIRPNIKRDVSESKIGGFILQKTSGIERSINQVFGGALNEALTYMTVEPKSGETLKLDTGENKLTIDPASEERMLTDLNRERTSRGLNALTLDNRHRDVAREYARDMWERRYFSHYSPEGEDVGDRLNKKKVSYQIAGENLAMAPTEDMAHTGLMNSEGHRANILEPDFNKVGIGVIDNGIYGKIFVQVFTN